MRSLRFHALVLLLSLVGGAARAQEGWRLEPLVRLGDRVGELTLPATGYFRVGTLNDAGQLLVVAKGPGAAPEGAPFYHVESVRLTAHHPGALLLAHASTNHSHHDPRLPTPPLSLYRWVDGALTPLVLIDQKVPGGRLWTIEPGGVSPMNAAGEVAFLARLTSEQTALYLRRADGTLSLLLKTGTSTAFGKVAAVGRASGASTGVALNNHGQIAVTLKIGRAPDTLYLLTPAPR